MRKIFMYIIDFILFLVAVILFLILTPINYFYIEKRYRYSFTMAYNLDLFGNHYFAPLFNKELILKNGHKFGNPKETISEVLGRNINSLSLSKKGTILVFILTKKHCLDSIK